MKVLYLLWNKYLKTKNIVTNDSPMFFIIPPNSRKEYKPHTKVSLQL